MLYSLNPAPKANFYNFLFKDIIMKYIALLRGINVGGKRKVEMKRLRTLFKSIGHTNVATYLNSGNVLFESSTKQETLQNQITKKLKKEFGFEIPTLIKKEREMKKIAKAIPKKWKYDSKQYTQIAYLFPEIDSKKTIDEFPVKKEFIKMKYVKGAIIWNVKKENYSKSHLNYVFNLRLYQLMTVRNLNTAKFLG